MAVRFERRLAGRFGHGRIWLAGDAAHLTSPVGGGEIQAGPAAGPWVRENAQSLLPCLPASSDDLAILMNQLGLELR